MVPRAVEILQSVDLIAAEDTRRSARLLKRFAIDTPMVAYHDHGDGTSLRKISACIERGGAAALISDAGTPLISDPGYRLLCRAHERGWAVSPVPGASALVAALSVAGLATDRFRFEGFLPAKRGARLARLETLATDGATLAFYEAPHRLAESVADMREVFGGERLAVLARELTKLYETVSRLPLEDLAAKVAADPDQRRGEIVLLVEGAVPREGEIGADVERVLLRLARELPPKKSAALAAELFGVNKKVLYDYLISR